MDILENLQMETGFSPKRLTNQICAYKCDMLLTRLQTSNKEECLSYRQLLINLAVHANLTFL